MSVLGSKNSTTSVADLTNGFVNTAQTGIVLVTLNNNDTTPTVAGSNAFLASNSSPTSITNFDDGVEGQLIRVLATNGNTTLVHDTTKIKLFGGVNIVMGTNTARTFQRDASNIWWEIGGGGGATFNDGANPSSSHPSDAAATGDDTFAARRDHVHEREEIVFYDDFMYDPQTDPESGASGVWHVSGSGGTSRAQDTGNTDASAFGVHGYTTTTTLGSTIGISNASNDVWPYTLVEGMEIGFRVRRHATDANYSRGKLQCGFSNLNIQHTSGGTIQLGFVIQKSDHDYGAPIGTDQAYFIAKNGANVSYVAAGATSGFTGFHNIKIIIGSGLTAECFVDGASQGTLSGSSMPGTSDRGAFMINFQIAGDANPASANTGYIDKFYIDTSRVNRGAN